MLSQVADSQEAKKRAVEIRNYRRACHEVLEAFDIDQMDRMKEIVQSTGEDSLRLQQKVLENQGFAFLNLQKLVKDI